MSLGVPYDSRFLESRNTKYPGIPGKSLGVPYDGGYLESRNTKYPGIPGIIPWCPI